MVVCRPGMFFFSFQSSNFQEALRMIYSRDVEHHGGNVLNAAEAVENMVDVCVDQVCNFIRY